MAKFLKIEFKFSFPLFSYALKRILIFLPTLFLISLLTFVLLAISPSDPAENMLNRNSGGDARAADKLSTDKAYQELKHRLGLDLPVFYFSFDNLASCDTINRIFKKDQRETLERLIYDYGNWPQISNYYNSANRLELAILNVKRDSVTANRLINLRNAVNKLYINYSNNVIQNLIGEMDTTISAAPQLASLIKPMQEVKQAYEEVQTKQTSWKKYVPVIHWNGTKSQYHRWLLGDAKWFGTETDPYKTRGFLRGDFGISYFAKRPVSSVIWDGLTWTLLLSIMSIILQYLIAVPIGIYSAVNKDTNTDSAITTALFILYSLPTFWIGTLLIFFLCSAEYINLFPPFGLGDTTMADGFFTRIGDIAYHLILPLFCYTYTSFAYLSRQMRGGMLSIMRQDYIRTAYAKGLPQKQVIWRHVFRNSLLPIITNFAYVFPALIGGSIIIESLFTIPGLGSITYNAVIQKDYPMVLATTMFAAVLTLIGYLIADILYAVVDPRISYSKKEG